MAARLIVLLALLAASARAVEFTYTENDNSGNNIALGFSPPQPVETTIAGDYFRAHASLLARHQELMLDSASIRGQIVGDTWRGEDIWVYRFGDGNGAVADDGVREGAVFINGSIHAREWQTQEAVTGLMEFLDAIRDDGGIGTWLDENLDVFILPLHNIDGFRQTQRYWNKVTQSEDQPRDGRMRRKNMHAPDGSAVDESLATLGDNLFGVDLNRNTEHGFGSNGGSSSDSRSLVYRGPNAHSEPETQALLAAAALVPAGQLRFFEDVHSYSQLMYVPQTGESVRDEVARALAHGMSNAIGGRYEVFPDPVNGYIGTTSDYFAYTYGVPSWTLELEPHYSLRATQYGGIGVSHDGFILPEAEVARLRDEFNRMHLAVFYEMAGPAIVRQLAIRRVDDGEVVLAAEWLPGGGNSRVLDVSVEQTLQPETGYELWLAFSKPIHADSIDPARDATAHLVDEQGGEQLIVFEPQWLAQPGGAFDGYRRYRHDAFRATFTLPGDVPGSGDAERRMLAIETSDLARRALDADPATIAGFRNGKWTHYERYPGVTNNSASYGNRDCTVTISVGPDADDIAAAMEADACQSYLEPEGSPDDDPPDPPASSGGGGGALDWLALWFLITTLCAGRRSGALRRASAQP